MEAHDKWQHISNSFEKLSDAIARKTKVELDHVTLQSHLAKLDAKDYMEDTGKTIANNFKVSRSKVEKTTLAAINDMEEYFKRIGKRFHHHS